MPVDMSKYPKDWPEIRARILKRAGGCDDDPRVGARCEFCGALNYAVGHRDKEGNFIPVRGDIFYDDFQYAVSYEEAREVADFNNEMDCDGIKYIVIVLTIAHLHDPDPMNVRDDNLAALCQRCHNRLDAEMRQKNRKLTSREKLIEAGQLVLV